MRGDLTLEHIFIYRGTSNRPIMLGDRDVRKMIEKTFDKIYDNLEHISNKNDPDTIHVLEASRCTRLSYYERKDPNSAPGNTNKVSILLKDGIRRSFSNVEGEYKVDNLTIQGTADTIVDNQYVVRFDLVSKLPETPHPRDLLYLNACLFIFNKIDGVLIYMTPEGQTLEFFVTKNNRMFEEVVRRARILSTLLKENKVPIIEPSDLCLNCKYYERCYYRERKISTLSLESLFGRGKKE
jgi:CRISPR-associated exonuclease Cas4